MDSISFFKLPLLVQSKILREHVPVFQKAFTLSIMPEFDDMLQSKHSWLNSSKEFFNFYNLLRSFKPGLYVCYGKDWWTHGCFVSITHTTVSFIFCCITKYTFTVLNDNFSNIITLKIKESILKTTTFLATFLKNYIFFDEKILSFYKLHYGYFFVNRLTNDIYWLDGSIHTFNRNKCIITDKFCLNHVELWNDKNVIHLKCLAMSERIWWRCPCRVTFKILKPIKFKNFSIHYHRKAIKFKLEMDDENNDYVSISVQNFSKNVCRMFLNPELFKNSFPEMLSSIY